MDITKHEYNSVLYLLAKPLFLGMGFSQILSMTQNAAIISVLLGLIIGFFIIYLFYKMPIKSNKIFISLYSFAILSLGLILTTKMIREIYLDNTSVILIILPLLLILYYLSTKKENTIYRVASIIIIINTLLIGSGSILLLPQFKIDNFLPIFCASYLNIIKASLAFAFISATPYILLPDFKTRFNYKIYLGSTISLLLLFILIIGSLGNLSYLYTYPEYMVFKRISFLNFIKNMENIFFLPWFTTIFIMLSLVSNNIKRNTSKLVFSLALLFSGLITIWVLLINKNIFNMIYLNYVYILVIIIIIYLIDKWLISHLRK